jgi:hypothetical protein
MREERALRLYNRDMPRQTELPVVDRRTSMDSGPIEAAASKEIKQDDVPQRALMGISMLGNLDALYQRYLFSSIKLLSMTNGTRQKAGGVIIFAYTLG